MANYPNLSTDAENSDGLGRGTRLALLQLHHGVGSGEGDALTNAVRPVRKLYRASVAREVIAARERVAPTA